MSQAPLHVPKLIPPLAWRAPALAWTPLALLAAIGGPALLLSGDPRMARGVAVAGAAVYALAMASLALAWARGKPPHTHRDVIIHIVVTGALAALAAPFIAAWYVNRGAGSAPPFSLGDMLAMAPLSLVVGLPACFVSAALFSLIALVKPRRGAPAETSPEALFP